MPNIEERKNQDFVQFSRKVMAAHRQLIKTSPVAAEVLSLLVESMNKQNAVVCSYKFLMEVTGYSRTTLHRAIKLLQEEKWMQIVKLGTANAYVINSAAFWSSHANGKQYSVFHATVIAAASEQDKSIDDMRGIKLKKPPRWNTLSEFPIIGNDELPPPDQQDLDI